MFLATSGLRMCLSTRLLEAGQHDASTYTAAAVGSVDICSRMARMAGSERIRYVT